jgi:KilA-N domain
MPKARSISVKDTVITVIAILGEDYISLTDMVRKSGDDHMIYSWMRNRNTVEFLGIWEQLYNPKFKSNEFVTFKTLAGLNNFNLTPRKWILATNAKGLVSKAGRYGGGTYAHKDIAFEFGSWLSAEFKLYLIKEFQRLKNEENLRYSLNWNLQRTLAKINYRIHTDVIKERLLPPILNKKHVLKVYANEADILNVALFGKTAKEWRSSFSDKQGNIRDYATLEQLVVLTNLESINSVFIRQGLSQSERLVKLNETARTQMKSLLYHRLVKKIT